MTLGEAHERGEKLVEVVGTADGVERVAVAPHLTPLLRRPRDRLARQRDALEPRPDEVDAQLPARLLDRLDRDAVLLLPVTVAVRGEPRLQRSQPFSHASEGTQVGPKMEHPRP